MWKEDFFSFLFFFFSPSSSFFWLTQESPVADRIVAMVERRFV